MRPINLRTTVKVGSTVVILVALLALVLLNNFQFSISKLGLADHQNSNGIQHSLSSPTNLSVEFPGKPQKTLLEMSGFPEKNKENKSTLLLTLSEIGSARLGNQMFRYASLLGLARILNRVPALPPDFVVEKTFQIRHTADSQNVLKWTPVQENHYATFDLSMIQQLRTTFTNVSISGYLQSWKYFHHIRDEIRQEFVFRNSTRRKAEEILGYVRRTLTKYDVLIGVHVRRGDMSYSNSKQSGYTVAERNYFLKAFDWMRKKFRGQRVIFFVASDEISWSYKNLAADDVVYMPGTSPSVHLFLLASCDHVIMSVGTFGWWGAWLAGGIVIYYADFPARGSDLARHYRKEDYYPPEWISMGE